MHLIHLIQRRFPHRAVPFAAGLFVVSAAALALGVGLLLLTGLP